MFSVYPIPSWWLREYIALSYYHHQIGSMNYHPLFRVRSWNNGMRCMSLYILIKPSKICLVSILFSTKGCPPGQRTTNVILSPIPNVVNDFGFLGSYLFPIYWYTLLDKADSSCNLNILWVVRFSSNIPKWMYLLYYLWMNYYKCSYVGEMCTMWYLNHITIGIPNTHLCLCPCISVRNSIKDAIYIPVVNKGIGFIILLRPLLLIWFNFNPSMDK